MGLNIEKKETTDSYLPEIKEGTEIKINKHLSVKFEENQTRVYVDNNYFRQCIRIFLNISVEQMDSYNEINSIDEAVDIEKQLSLWQNQVVIGDNPRDVQIEHIITPEEEFWGHYSNLQTWYENEYDTRILHRNIAFPLLKKLMDAGDKLAKRKFKDEIFTRFQANYPTVTLYLIEVGALKYLTKEELSTLSERLTDPIHRLRTRHYHFLYKEDPAFYYSIEGRLEFVKDVINQFKKQDTALTVKALIKEDFLRFFYSNEIKELAKYVKSTLIKRLLPHYHKKNEIEYNVRGYDVVIYGDLWVKKLRRDKFNEKTYKHIYSLNDRNNFKKIKINSTVYYDFDIIEKKKPFKHKDFCIFPYDRHNRKYIRYKDLWNAYRFLNKNHDCKLSIPDPTCKDFETFRMISKSEGYSIKISAEVISLNDLKKKRDDRRKRLYRRIEKRRYKKYRELCIQIFENQIDQNKCDNSNCYYYYKYDFDLNQNLENPICSCIYKEKSFHKISSALSYSCKQKKVFEKNNAFKFLRNRIQHLHHLEDDKDERVDFLLWIRKRGK